MAKNLVFILTLFTVGSTTALAAAECEQRLQSAETIYMRLILAAVRDGLLGPTDLALLSRGEIINPLAQQTVRASSVQLKKALARVFPQVVNSAGLSERLRTLASLKSEEQVERERAMESTRTLFAPAQIHAFKTSLNDSSTKYFWYRDTSDRLLLAIQQAQDLVIRVFDPLKGKVVVERSPESSGKVAHVAQSPFFLQDGRLMMIYESPTAPELVLYDVFSDFGVPVASRFNPSEIQLIESAGQRYAVATDKDGFEVFLVGRALSPLQAVMARNPMSDFRILSDGQGRLNVVARDNKSVFIYNPLEAREPVSSVTLGDANLSEWLVTLNADLTPDGHVVVAAFSSGQKGEGHLYILRPNQAALKMDGFAATDSSRTLSLLFHHNVHGGLLLSILDKNKLRVMDPLGDHPRAGVVAEGWITAASWLSADGASSNLLAFSERQNDGNFKRRILELDDAHHLPRPAADFLDEGVGGEQHIRRPDGQWLYLATDYNRAIVTDGLVRPRLVPAAVHVLNSSPIFEVASGQYIVAVNSGTHDRFNLRVLRLTGRVSN